MLNEAEVTVVLGVIFEVPLFLCLLQADCNSPVWSRRNSAYDSVYCSDLSNGKAQGLDLTEGRLGTIKVEKVLT